MSLTCLLVGASLLPQTVEFSLILTISTFIYQAVTQPDQNVVILWFLLVLHNKYDCVVIAKQLL